MKSYINWQWDRTERWQKICDISLDISSGGMTVSMSCTWAKGGGLNLTRLQPQVMALLVLKDIGKLGLLKKTMEVGIG